MKKGLRLRVVAAAVFLPCLVTTIAAPAQTFKVLASFDGTDGEYPVGGVVQGFDGNFYGTTAGGGNNGSTCLGTGCGTIFKVTPAGTLTTLYSFCSQTNCTDGYGPVAALVQATDGNLYGITQSGGANNNTQICLYVYLNGCGTVFKVTPTGVLTTLYSFCSLPNCADGVGPYSSLVQGTDGNFYGTTNIGGSGFDLAVCGITGCGTIFKITPTGTLTTLHSMCSEGGSSCTDGAYPQSGLIEGLDGNLYGTTAHGGINGGGTVFKITPSGALTTLYSFCAQAGCPDGSLPAGNLVQATDGNFYGTTFFGGDRRLRHDL